jgi:hypothetical protein
VKRNQLLFLLFSPAIAVGLAAAAVGDFLRDFRDTYRRLGDTDE